jgi:hypothetical protein
LDLHPRLFDRARHRLRTDELFVRSTEAHALFGARVRLPSTPPRFLRSAARVDRRPEHATAHSAELFRTGRRRCCWNRRRSVCRCLRTRTDSPLSKTCMQLPRTAKLTHSPGRSPRRRKLDRPPLICCARHARGSRLGPRRGRARRSQTLVTFGQL